MGLIGWIKGVIGKMFQQEAKTRFGTDPIVSNRMTAAVARWMCTYTGNPEWLDDDDNVRTINFAKAVCSETARLATLAIKVDLSGGPRAQWLQAQLERCIFQRLRAWVEYGAAGGTVIFKPNGHGIDVVTPDRFMITEADSNKNITGAVFQDQYTVGRKIYTRLEYHRFTQERVYMVSTRTFVSESESDIGRQVPIDSTKWAGIEPEVSITQRSGEPLDGPLFGVFVMPEANNIDLDSPLGMSIFAGAMEEMRDLDIAYSRYAEEQEDSRTIELLDDTLIAQDGKKTGKTHINLPRHVHNVFGNGIETFYQQIDRPIKTAERKVGMDMQLSLIGYKCGFSNGYFVFDQKTGMVTATQVESDDRRTIQLIKDIRDNLERALRDTIYAMGVFADLYELAPVGDYTVDFDFGDITYNVDEDRMRNYQLMMQGIIPKWFYLVKFEGYGEDEAKQIVAEAEQVAQQGLFAKEE